jgi:hypothetical protein
LAGSPPEDTCFKQCRRFNESSQLSFLFNQILSEIPTLLQAKIAQQDKQMRVGAQKGFQYFSVKLVLLANGNRHEVDSKTFFKAVKPYYSFKRLPCPKSDLS